MSDGREETDNRDQHGSTDRTGIAKSDFITEYYILHTVIVCEGPSSAFSLPSGPH